MLKWVCNYECTVAVDVNIGNTEKDCRNQVSMNSNLFNDATDERGV